MIRRLSSTSSELYVKLRLFVPRGKSLLAPGQKTLFPITSRSITTSVNMASKFVTPENINQHLRVMEYAVRGPIVIRAGEIERELKSGTPKRPYKRVIRANIGDCHATGQQPITFIRQVLAVCTLPSLKNNPDIPQDVKDRAELLLSSCGGHSVGAYSDSAGIDIVKKHVAEYITQRDGGKPVCDPLNIILQGGASEGVRAILSMLNQPMNGKAPGVMIPIPQYPLYSATLAEYGMSQINYYLDEEHEWALDISELERSLNEAKKTCQPRALVVINPGNPTGSVLTKDNIRKIIKFAYDNGLFVLADEVYQHNVYAEGAEFHSFRKVMYEMGAPYDSMELSSFMSASKGFMGECGLRGGYVEICNFDPEVKRVLLKSISAKLCSTVLGQCAMDCIVKGPDSGSPSYSLYQKERNDVLSELKDRAKLVADTFNTLEGFRCNKVAGAMYAFPQFQIPPKAIEKAKSLGQEPDFFYAMQLLEQTGVCIVPGSGFGQRPGTFHFRTTILPQTDVLKEMLNTFKSFHSRFMKEYA